MQINYTMIEHNKKGKNKREKGKGKEKKERGRNCI
jgi:hypothetical protein